MDDTWLLSHAEHIMLLWVKKGTKKYISKLIFSSIDDDIDDDDDIDIQSTSAYFQTWAKIISLLLMIFPMYRTFELKQTRKIQTKKAL